MLTLDNINIYLKTTTKGVDWIQMLRKGSSRWLL